MTPGEREQRRSLQGLAEAAGYARVMGHALTGKASWPAAAAAMASAEADCEDRRLPLAAALATLLVRLAHETGTSLAAFLGEQEAVFRDLLGPPDPDGL